jgi:Ca-activated chloride channel family protein
MQRWLSVLFLGLACAAPASAQAVLVPTDPAVPPLTMVGHQIDVALHDQAAVTTVTQVFRNSASRPLEADYLFPVPKGAAVTKFTMWVDGKEVPGEMVEAAKARDIYTGIVRRMQDPGLLEYVGNNLLRLRVFPVPAHGEQKLMVKFTSVADRESGLVEYVYPMKCDGKAVQALEKFDFHATIKAQSAVQNVYSPTHPVTIKHVNDHEVTVSCEGKQAGCDKDLQLFYALGDKDVGLTALTHRPTGTEDGTFMMLVSPRAELSKSQQVPRDMVFVLDTSGSMAGVKMEQARKAMKFCVNQLDKHDRFALINFASTVNKYRDSLTPATAEQLAPARKWIDALQATGGTAIDAALTAALDLRSSDTHRSFTIVFFTDGMPTVGETNPDTILKNVEKRNTANTRIFTFGVGDDVNALLLDRLAQQTRAVSTYVRPAEDIEVKVSGLYEKISHPVLTNLKLAAGKNVTLKETYPPQLPDLFHGGQLVVLGKYTGHGHAAITLTGQVGSETKEFVYEINFAKETSDEKAFVEDLWARRKVGYLLDLIRANGENKELVDEVTALAKKHGITTPYTSLLVVPDTVTLPPVNQPVMAPPPPALNVPMPDWRGHYHNHGVPATAPSAPQPTTSAASVPSGVFVSPSVQWAAPGYSVESAPARATDANRSANEQQALYAKMRSAFANGQSAEGELGVDVALEVNALRTECRVTGKVTRQAFGRTLVNVGGAWVDDKYDAKLPVVRVKAQSDAYFRLLEKQPKLKEVFQLGNRVAWVTPGGSLLVIEAGEGKDQLSDEEIAKLFTK